jgi:hypothetical protein
MRHRVKERALRPTHATDPPLHTPAEERAADDRSLDLVQRVVGSVLAIVVGGGIAVLLAVLSTTGWTGLDRTSTIGLWVMSGFAGMVTAAAVLVINQRHPYSPLLLLGLLPAAITAFWIWT